MASIHSSSSEFESKEYEPTALQDPESGEAGTRNNSLSLARTETVQSLTQLGIGPNAEETISAHNLPVQDPMFPEEFTLETPSGLVRVETLRSLGRKESEKEVDPEIELVTFTIDDPLNPHNWSMAWKWFYTFIFAVFVVCAAYGSSCLASGLELMEARFHVGAEVSTLTVSLMVLGFSLGPLIWAPLSEQYGRRTAYFISFGLYTVMNIPCALTPNIGGLLAARFVCGVLALSALTNVGASLVDIHNETRGLAIAFFSFAPYSGPVIGGLCSGFIAVNTNDFRYIVWVNMAFAGVMWIIVAFIPETYAPVILKRRAQKLRKETGNPKIMTEQELSPLSFKELANDCLIRPLRFIVEEPVLDLMCGYVALVYALLYAFFYAYPVIFQELYGFGEDKIGLMFVPILIGAIMAVAITPILEKNYVAMCKRRTPVPEDRLVGAMLGCAFPCISLFILGATSYKHIIWVGPASSGIAFGFGMVLIYYSLNNYIIDVYAKYASSALATKVFLRSSAGAAFPLFITQMYHRLGLQWASWLLAFISLAMATLPFLFYKFGAGLRAKMCRNDYTLKIE